MPHRALRSSWTGCKSANAVSRSWNRVVFQNQRSDVSVQLDDNIQTAKLDYELRIGNVFACIFPNSADAYASKMFPVHTCDYLRRTSYLVCSVGA